MAKPQGGSSTRLNTLLGFSTTVRITEENKVAYANNVYPAGTFLHDDNGFLYHADGKMTLTELLAHPIVNKNYDILTPAERKMITDFNKANGFVATDEFNKINDDQLNLVESGLLKDSYLSKYVGEDGKIRPEVIPMDIRAHMKFLATYEELEEVEEGYKSGLFFVIDASGDPTVEKGWAVYVWQYNDPNAAEDEPNLPHEGSWVKIQEGEGIDYDYDSITTHDSVEKTGALMYDHIVFMQSPTLDQLASLADPVLDPVFETFPTTIAGYDKSELALNISITEKHAVAGQHSIVFTVAPESTVVIKGFDDGDADKDNPRTLTGESAEDLNTKLKALKLVTGATGGTFTMVLDEYDSKTVTVSVTEFKEPTVLKADVALDAMPNVDTPFPVRLSTEGVDPDKQYSVIVTPTGCAMKDDSSSSVTDGTPWNISADTVANINLKLQSAMVVNDTDGGTVAVQITGGDTQTLTVNTVWAAPTLSGSETLTAGDGTDVALGVSLGVVNVNPTQNYTVTITSEGVDLKDDTGAPVTAGTPITYAEQTCAAINAKMGLVKVTGDTDGGTVTVQIADGASKTVTVSAE